MGQKKVDKPKQVNPKSDNRRRRSHKNSMVTRRDTRDALGLMVVGPCGLTGLGGAKLRSTE